MAQVSKKAPIDLSKYEGGLFNPVIDRCEGCERIVEANKEKFCSTYIAPEAKWKLGICNFATHIKPEISATAHKVNPIKASKRAAAAAKKKK